MKNIKINEKLHNYMLNYRSNIQFNGKTYNVLIEEVKDNVFDVEDDDYYIVVVEYDKLLNKEIESTVQFIDLENSLISKLNDLNEKDFKTFNYLIKELINIHFTYRKQLNNLKDEIYSK